MFRLERMFLSRSIILVPFLLGGLLADAQTMFIPDTYLRGWLNSAKPGSVDVDGYCDTIAWNAVPPYLVEFYLNQMPDNSTADLAGIQYLKMDYVIINDAAVRNITVLWPGYPRANTALTLRNVGANLIQGPCFPLPDAITSFDCRACMMTSIPDFQGTSLSISDVDLSGPQVIPPSLTSLTLLNCNITSLPPLPALTSLTVADDDLTGFPALPASLNFFDADNIGVADLPPLPSGLGFLYYTRNGVSSLPSLPGTLTTLELNGNDISTLPALPGSLHYLEVVANPISELIDLPGGLLVLDADSCPITALGPLPATLVELHLTASSIPALPALPPALTDLHLKGTAQLGCLPLLPSSLTTLHLYASGVACLPNIPPDLDITGGQNNLGIAAVLCDPGNSACPIVDPLVTGTVFNDANANGILDGGESVRPFATIEAQPGNFLAGSNWDGEYVLPADTGSFIVTGQPTLYEGTTTAPYAVSFASIGEVDSLNDIGYEVVPGIYDLVTTLETVPTRPGFETTLWVSVQNMGTEITDASVDLTFDGNLTYVDCDYTPDAVNGNVAEWTTGSLYPGYTWTAAVTLYTPPGIAIGTPLLHQASAIPDQADMTPPDNTALLNDTVVGSYDPNDKRVMPQEMTPAQVASGAPLTWTVRFQNTGTYPAERVLITDTLSADLRANTMDVIASSHAHTWYILNGVLHVLFQDINLPDSASDETGSHGFIKFGMKPQGALPDGTVVENVANIYFDFNEPVITAPAVFTVDASNGIEGADRQQWNIWPNPVEEMLFIGGLPPGANALFEVVDINGAIVRTEPGIHGTAWIDVHDLATGAYALRYLDGTVPSTHTFIKH
jgi:uncharacterized repeat protein (TIGR01451 family)